MNQKDLLDSIKKYLARFDAQVRISSANNEYDINIHAENVIIPVLNLAYDLELKNANFSEGKNNEAIDLIDEGKGVGFQVTSTKSIDKIKNTLSKFATSKIKSKIKSLYFYILREKQNYYNQDVLDKAADKQVRFTVKEHIIDSSDLYRKLYERNDIEIIKKIEQILRSQFSDIYINKSFTLSNYEDFRTQYKQSCLANFSRINFFGLSVSTNKPREIELYSLFVSPTFSSDRYYVDHIVSNTRFVTYDNFDFKGDEKVERKLSTEHLKSIWLATEASKYFKREIIKLEDTISLNLFENFHSDLLKNEKIEFRNFFSGPKDIVVIGKPGAGKSSFVKYAICKILEKDTSVFENQEIFECTPFRIELHKYNRFKKNKGGGLLEYLSEQLKNEYLLTLSTENVTSILQAFPTLIFFDGLDEIFDIQERISVRNDIEMFVRFYSLSRSVVTSRYESYEEVSLSGKIFREFELLDFSDTQVEEYVKKWYSIEESNITIHNRESNNCLQQLKSVEPELKHNPLLLSLILLLYRNELDIPTSKLSIYESCTNTIVETRDIKEKKLDIKLKIVNKISVFASLAYWQFTRESLGQSAPTFEEIKSQVKTYLLSKGEFSDDSSAQQATEEFLEFAKLRSIYFENKFTHKTFLEYFTAYYIYSFYYNNWRKSSEFSRLLTNYIGLSAWQVVLELLICKIDSNQIDYSVIDGLTETLYEKGKIDTLIFFLQILKYIRNISPRMTKFIVEKSIEYCFRDGEATKESKADYRELLFAHLCSLINIEQYKEIIEVSFTKLIDIGKTSDLLVSAFAYEFAIVSGDTSLVKILQNKGLESTNAYIFILKHYPNLFDNNKFLDSLKLFISACTLSAVSIVFRSQFRQKIFYNSEKFNWVVSYIAKNVAKENLYSTFVELREAGVSDEILVESARNRSADMQFYDLEGKFSIQDGKDASFERFQKALMKTYYTNENIATKKVRFYGGTFSKFKRKRRK